MRYLLFFLPLFFTLAFSYLRDPSQSHQLALFSVLSNFVYQHYSPIEASIIRSTTKVPREKIISKENEPQEWRIFYCIPMTRKAAVSWNSQRNMKFELYIITLRQHPQPHNISSTILKEYSAYSIVIAIFLFDLISKIFSYFHAIFKIFFSLFRCYMVYISM